MILKKFLFLVTLLAVLSVKAQSDKTVLFTIDGDEVYTSEFTRVYQKNLDILTDESQKDKKNYLDLFVNYKLKVQQARDLGYDTLPTYKKELQTYKKQLMEPYLKDESVVEGLVLEAYERSLKEINASHILILVGKDAQPKDTLAAYNKISKARAEIINGKSFEEVAKKYSEDRSVEKNEGKLGYFTVFNMVYPFETAAYNTAKESVSKPFRTQFGYHIVKVNDIRDALGEVEVAHIMMKGLDSVSESKINEIYQQLAQGEDFGYLAKTQSEDKYSAKEEGRLTKFGSGKMVKEFEDKAFSLKIEGDYSTPFKTPYGWHIVKLIKKFPIRSFNESKADLETKVKRSDRSKIVNSSIVNKLKKEYQITVHENAYTSLESKDFKNDKLEDVVLLEINEKSIPQKEFVKYLNGRKVSKQLFSDFENAEILKYYKNYLENNDTEFAHIYKEYEEGLLLFELLQNKIWNASKDSIAVESYYNKHEKEYVLEKRFEGVIAVSSSKKTAKKVKKELTKNNSVESIKKMINSDDKVKVTFKQGTFFKNSELIPLDYNLEKGVSKIYKLDNKFIVIKSDKILNPEQQAFEDVRGRVISDYQEELEKEWIKELHNSYTIQMNEEAVNSVINK